MKKYLKIASVFAIAASLVSCHKEILIPDPGFDMSETVLDTVRRDTSAAYSVAFNVKAPNGVQSIELLNGRNFEKIMEFPEYVGEKDFEFNHVFDLSACDEEKDSLFIYNIKIRTNDNRGYNKTIRVLHMRKSHPEITGPSETMNLFGRAFVFDGNVTTGYYTIESIKAELNGEEVFNAGAAELNGATNYSLHQQITKDFEKGKTYKYNVIVKDSKGEEVTFTYNLVSAALKKPVAYRAAHGSSAEAAIFHYNDKQQVEWVYDCMNGGHFLTMQYDNAGRMRLMFRTTASTIGERGLATANATAHGYGSYSIYFDYNEDGSLRRYVLFGYKTVVEGVTHVLLDPWWLENMMAYFPDSGKMADMNGTPLEGFVTSVTASTDPAFNKYREYGGKRFITDMMNIVNTETVGPLEYIEDYEEGNLLHTMVLGYSMAGVNPFWGTDDTQWARVCSYSTALNPMYVPDFPLPMQMCYSGYSIQQMFGAKYAISSVRGASEYEDDLTKVYAIPYSVRADGILKSWYDIAYGVSSWTYEQTYYYDDEPDTWRSLVDQEAEDCYQWFKFN